jgi:hypothetical protein
MPNENNSDSLIPIAQMILRLMGVYFFIVGASYFAEKLSQAYLSWKRYDFDTFFFDHLILSSLWGELVYIFAGIYLMVGGHWLINNVFLPSSHSKPSDVDTSTPLDTDTL